MSERERNAQLVGDREGRNVYGWFIAELLTTVSGYLTSVAVNASYSAAGHRTHAASSPVHSPYLDARIVYIRCWVSAWRVH